MPASSATSLKLGAAMKERLQRLASIRQWTARWLMREAIEQCLEREERRESLHRDALAAWQDDLATGLHVTAAEADEWLAKLEAGEDMAPPACHA